MATETRSNADQHGPTCADTPLDHRCGDTEEDQGVTWSEWSQIRSEQLRAITEMHANGEVPGGGTTGYCAECSWQWPCSTYHIAAGWGLDSYHDCEEQGWCSHANVLMNRRTPDEIDASTKGVGEK